MRNLLAVGVLVAGMACWTDVGVDEPEPTPLTVCEQDALRCDGTVLQLCADDGMSWVPLEVCESAAHCDPAFGCQPSACTEGESRCNDSMFQRCAPSRLSWDSVEQCISAAACEPLTGCR